MREGKAKKGPGPRVLVLYNHPRDDRYEELRKNPPPVLDFEPTYPIEVSTALEEYHAVVDALREEGFDAWAVNLEEEIDTLTLLLQERPPDVIFNLVEYFTGSPHHEAYIAGVYELYEVPYTGATPFALALCQRKGLTKQVLLANGVPTPRYRLLHHPRIPRRHGLHYPLIVKPAHEDASAGLDKGSVVYGLDQLLERIELVYEKHRQPILVEEFIEGRELHVPLLGNDPPRVLPVVEYDFSDLPDDYPRIISHDAKWNPLAPAFHQVHEICPARLTRRLEKRVREIAVEAYRLTGCRDYARMDLRITKDDRLYVLEVNPNPDLTESVSFMNAAEEAGLGFSEVLRTIVACALRRGARMASSGAPEESADAATAPVGGTPRSSPGDGPEAPLGPGDRTDRDAGAARAGRPHDKRDEQRAMHG